MFLPQQTTQADQMLESGSVEDSSLDINKPGWLTRIAGVLEGFGVEPNEDGITQEQADQWAAAIQGILAQPQGDPEQLVDDVMARMPEIFPQLQRVGQEELHTLRRLVRDDLCSLENVNDQHPQESWLTHIQPLQPSAQGGQQSDTDAMNNQAPDADSFMGTNTQKITQDQTNKALPLDDSAQAFPMTGAVLNNGATVVSVDAPRQQPVSGTAGEVVNQIVQQMETAIHENLTECEIQLRPEYLGKVSIHLVMQNNALTARIQVQEQSVRAMMDTQLMDLRKTLEQQGITVANMEIVDGSIYQNHNQQQRNPQQADEKAQQRQARIARVMNSWRVHDQQMTAQVGQNVDVEAQGEHSVEFTG